MMAWFDKDRVYQESFYSGFITDPYNLQKTIYVSNNTIELITILTEHMPESSSRPNTITYFITGVNFEDSYNKTLVLDANKAKKINSNIYQIVEREGMAPRRATSAFIFYNCTRGNSTCFTVGNGFLKKLDIYVNATNNLFNEYLITCEAQAEQEEGPLCEKVLILPFSVFYPFEKNYTFISDRELKTITIYLNDSFYPEETRKAFGITSYTPKQSFILVSSPETSKRKFLITFRKNLSCENCNYLILTVSWGEGILVKSYNGNSFGCVVDIEELNNSYPFLPIYLLNFSINVSSAKCLRIPDLVGKIGDKKWFTSVYLSEPKGKLKITREADGATFETNVTAGSFWESVREFMNRKGIYTIEWDPGILKNKACITAVINLTDTLLPSFTFLSYTKGKMIDGSCIPKSLIENTGNVPIKGYLVMKVKKRKEKCMSEKECLRYGGICLANHRSRRCPTGCLCALWQDEATIVNDLITNHLRTIPPKSYLGLDAIWIRHGGWQANSEGTFKVYAALVDSEGNVIETKQGKLEDSYEFKVLSRLA